MNTRNLLILFLFITITFVSASAGDWTMWGGTPGKNMISQEKDLPESFNLLAPPTANQDVHGSTGRLLWTTQLGTETFGSPVVADGRIYIGTNNSHPRDKRFTDDRGVLMCLSESDGKLLWQLAIPKIKSHGKFNGDRRQVGICSTPVVEGNRLYIVTNRCELLCLDVNGMADGNDGPFKEEDKYIADKSDVILSDAKDCPVFSGTPGKSIATTKMDADIIWRLDMITETGSWPQDTSNSCPVICGDVIFVGTSNGICKSHKRYALYPDAPSLIAVDKATGKLFASDNAQIGRRVWHGQWSSPSIGNIDDRNLVFYGGGDGICYAFSTDIQNTDSFSSGILPTVWSFDCNPKELRIRDGKPIRYKSRRDGPSEIIATPVFYQHKVYVSIGQDPTHGKGPGCLSCIDATQKGDISRTGIIWQFKEIERSISTVAIAEDLLIAADIDGIVYCLDANTGKLFWKKDTHSSIWSSPLIADGKIYVSTVSGDIWVLKLSKTCSLLSKNPFHARIYSSVVAANHKIFITTQNCLYVFEK